MLATMHVPAITYRWISWCILPWHYITMLPADWSISTSHDPLPSSCHSENMLWNPSQSDPFHTTEVAFHYIPPPCSYVAWNMHEPLPNKFDFTGILDLGEFIRTAQRVGLHVIVRPGPYICAEWELGGLPA